MRIRRNRTSQADATPDLTPMIDVTFQLLIFFILCTKFAKPEENFQVNLPTDEGTRPIDGVPKEQITIYCLWDDAAQANSYVVAIDARGRMPVDGSYATLDEMVIYSSDPDSVVRRKQARYEQVFNNLVAAVETMIERSGARIQKLEIAFAKDSTVGASSGTAPWMFVSTALDACAKLNIKQEDAGEEPYAVTFKFTDSLGVYR